MDNKNFCDRRFDSSCLFSGQFGLTTHPEYRLTPEQRLRIAQIYIKRQKTHWELCKFYGKGLLTDHLVYAI